jgi:hypothetical protein
MGFYIIILQLWEGIKIDLKRVSVVRLRWLYLWSRGGLCEHGNEPLIP